MGQSGEDKVFGGSDADLIKGGRGDDKLKGGGGNDEVRGGRGDDRLSGNAGEDTLIGKSGDDVLHGGKGPDWLDGSAGWDVCRGGQGADFGTRCEKWSSMTLVPPVVDTDGDGVPDRDDNCPVVPNADQSDRYGSPKGDVCEDDSNGDGVLDVDEPHVCIHIDGEVVVQRGDSICESTPTTGDHPNIAVAHGKAEAQVAFDGDHQTATADGDGSRARAGSGAYNTAHAMNGADVLAGSGSHNLASANGPGSTAYAWYGDENTVMVVGEQSEATAGQGGDRNVISITGDRSRATAGNGGDDNTALVVGDDSVASIGQGSRNTATARGDGTTAIAGAGSDNSSVAEGDNARAETINGNGNSATADGARSDAFAGEGDNNTATATNGGTARAQGDAQSACADEPGETALNTDRCGPPPATETIEAFDTDPGWSSLNSTINGNDFGFGNSAFAGRAAGEAGGFFNAASVPAWYGDSSIDPLDGTTPIGATGILNIVSVDAGYDGNVQIGHFDSTSSDGQHGIGFQILERGIDSFRVFYLAGGNEGQLFELTRLDTKRAWSYRYDPATASLDITISGPGGGTASVPFDGAGLNPLDTFGLRMKPGSSPLGEQIEIYLDDIVYTTSAP